MNLFYEEGVSTVVVCMVKDVCSVVVLHGPSGRFLWFLLSGYKGFSG